MTTINQLVRKPRKRKVDKNNVPALEGKPQKRGCALVSTRPHQKNQILPYGKLQESG